METRGIAVFDVCGTITQTNNTSDFVAFVLRRDSTLRYCLFLLVRILGSLSSFLGIRSVCRRDLPRAWQIALLRGYSRARIREMSELYVNTLFARGLLNRGILDAMKREREEGKAVVLVSAAIDPPIVEMARRLNAEGCFSSELEIADGRYTGRLGTDLLRNKTSVLERISAGVDLSHSSVYSNDVEDADFMESFGKRNAVLNTDGMQKRWDRGNGRFHFIVKGGEPILDKDICSVTPSEVKWTYVPFLYYGISRFRWEGLGTPLFRELIPATLAAGLFTDLGAFSLVLMPLSFLMFYCVYEIGGLVNDLHADKEAPGRGTRRISPGVCIHVGLFVTIRVAVITLVLVWLPVQGYPLLAYVAALGSCLAIYFIHTFLSGCLRVFSFTLLKLCRNAVPLVILASYAPIMTLVWLCTIFFAIDAPYRVWAYCRARGLIQSGLSVRRVRCMDLAILCGLGAIIYLAGGSPLLFAIASYYVAVECLWVVRATLSSSI